MKADLAVVVTAKDQKEREIEQKWSDTLDRERQKHERIVGVERAQHVVDLDNCRRKSQREWQAQCNGLQQQLRQLQKQVVGYEMKEVRRIKSAEVKEEELRLVVRRVRDEANVRACLCLFAVAFFIL
jgi:hypothetical protein